MVKTLSFQNLWLLQCFKDDHDVWLQHECSLATIFIVGVALWVHVMANNGSFMLS
jgi:hypothetical protein